MVTIEYSTGNGYSCSCCRITEAEIESFDSEDQAFERCLEIAHSYDWDFSVLNVSGAADNEALEKRIDAAVDQGKKGDIKAQKIRDLDKRIKENEFWLDNVEKEIARRQEQLNTDSAEMIKLMHDEGAEKVQRMLKK